MPLQFYRIEKNQNNCCQDTEIADNKNPCKPRQSVE